MIYEKKRSTYLVLWANDCLQMLQLWFLTGLCIGKWFIKFGFVLNDAPHVVHKNGPSQTKISIEKFFLLTSNPTPTYDPVNERADAFEAIACVWNFFRISSTRSENDCARNFCDTTTSWDSWTIFCICHMNRWVCRRMCRRSVRFCLPIHGLVENGRKGERHSQMFYCIWSSRVALIVNGIQNSNKR